MLLSDILNYAVYGIVAFFVLGGFVLGFWRGLNKQTIKFVAAIAGFSISFIIFTKILPLLTEATAGKSISEFLGGFGITLTGMVATIIDTVEADVAACILAIPLSIVVIPLGFTVVFFLVQGILIVPCMFLCGILGFGSRYNTIVTRILGAAVGVIQGALAVVVVFVPIAGILGSAGEAVRISEEKHPDSANAIAIGSAYHQNLDELEKNIVITTVDKYAGFIYEGFTNVEIDGENVDIETVVDDCFEIFVLYGDLSGVNYKELSEPHKQTISNMVLIAENDPFMAKIISGAMRSVAANTKNGNLNFGIEQSSQEFFNALLGVFETSDPTNVKSDLETFKEVYFILSDTGSIVAISTQGQSEMFNCFLQKDENGNTVVTRITNTLDANPRFYDVSHSLSTLALDMLLQNSGADAELVETVENVKQGINDVIAIKPEDYETHEEYKAEVSSGIDTTLKDNGIALEEEQLDQVTDYVIENLGGKDEITDLEFAEFMGKYYDIYASGSGTLPDLDDLPGGGEDIPDVEEEDIPDGEGE